MSSHLRHCPKHRKPLPCAHCALAKPARVVSVETLEPAPVLVIPAVPDPMPAAIKMSVCMFCGEPSETELCKRPECIAERLVEQRQDKEDYETKVVKSEREEEVSKLRAMGRVAERVRSVPLLKSVSHPVV